MKKIHLLILALVLVLIGCASNVPLTVPDKFDEVVVANVYFSMQDLEPPESADKGQFDFLTILKAKEIYKDFKKELEDTLYPRSYQAFLDSIYFTIVDSLKYGLNIPIQPFPKGQAGVYYDFYGFPMGNIKSVARKGKFDAVMGISVDISYASKRSSTESVFGVAKAQVKGKPKLTLRVKMVNKSGQIIWRDNMVVKSNEWVIADEKWLWGIRYKQDIAGLSAVEMVRQAVQQLVDKNKIKF